MSKKTTKQPGYIYILGLKFKWRSFARGAGIYFYIIMSIILLPNAIYAFYDHHFLKGILYMAALVVAVWIGFWHKIMEASELVETFIWGMPIKDPEWRTKRLRRRLVLWKKKKE